MSIICFHVTVIVQSETSWANDYTNTNVYEYKGKNDFHEDLSPHENILIIARMTTFITCFI